MINTNVRSIKVDKDCYHSRTKTRGAKDMCQFCGQSGHCMKQANSQEEIHECKDYRFPILFRDTQGLDDRFNTMRLGRAWSKRLRERDIVALVNKEGERVGFASVCEVLCLPKDEALRQHGEWNHLMLAGNWTSSVITQMEKILRSSYGNLIYNHNDDITVIYLQLIKGS